MFSVRTIEAALKLREIIERELGILDLMIVITHSDVRLKKKLHRNTLVRMNGDSTGFLLRIKVAGRVSGKTVSDRYKTKLPVCDIFLENRDKLNPLLKAIAEGYKEIYA